MRSLVARDIKQRSVIIDTNALMIPCQFGVDVFSELKEMGYNKFLVPEEVVKELNKLYVHAKGKDKTAASIALSLLDRCDIVEAEGNPDDVIIKIAEERGAAVVTNDIELKRRLKEKKITTVYLRQKKRLIVG
ncbi:MAG: DNA-binding protein [Methanosarcinales archaeon Met12]|nr:MAG: DNA-binding protein [Methanosarcinales archaeon Met12]